LVFGGKLGEEEEESKIGEREREGYGCVYI